MTSQPSQTNCLHHIFWLSIVTFLSTHIPLTLSCSFENTSDEVTGDKVPLFFFTINTIVGWCSMEIISTATLVYSCTLENDARQQQWITSFTFTADNESLSSFIF